MIDQINLNVTYSVVVLVIFVIFHLFSTHGAPTYEHTVHCKNKISWVIGSVPLAKYRLDTKPFYILYPSEYRIWKPDIRLSKRLDIRQNVLLSLSHKYIFLLISFAEIDFFLKFLKSFGSDTLHAFLSNFVLRYLGKRTIKHSWRQ